MRRMVLCVLVIVFVFPCHAVAEEGQNTFMSGITNISWVCGNGDAIYWLKGEWDRPANLYSMNLLDSQVTCLIEGDSNTWFDSILDAGDSLLISVSKEMGGEEGQILRVSYDASEVRVIAETAGAYLYVDGMLYYGDHASIYEMDLSTEKSRVIYSSNNPNCFIIILQYADDCLYFCEDEDDIYEEEEFLREYSIKENTVRGLFPYRGSFFVDRNFIFVSDFEKNTTFIMNLSTMEVIESITGSYSFSQGYENRILAHEINTYHEHNFMGGIYRIEYLKNGAVDIERVGSYDVGSDFVIDGRLYSYRHRDNIFVEKEW